ncbi:MAG: prepilin-type N-terminal cleavage/methylation domain-containing protein [Thermoguttaceae bacterium]
MKRRTAYTLVELMAAMAAASVLTAVAIGLIVTMLRSEGVARDHIRQSAVQGRLADQFRRDVHAAEAIDIDGSGLVWTLTLGPEHEVTYRVESNRLERTETGDPSIQRQETYVLPPDHTATLEMLEPTDPPIVSLSIVPTSKTIDAKPRPTVQFDAILAADRRYEEPAEEEDSTEEETDG